MMQTISHQSVTWTDVQDPSKEDIDTLAHNYPFHHLNLDDCVSKIQLTKIDEHGEYLFVVVHFPRYDGATGLIVPVQVSLFLGDGYLVTVHGGDFSTLAEMFRESYSSQETREEVLGKSSVYLLYRVLDKLTDDLFPLLDRIENELDDIDDKVYDEKILAAIETSKLQRRIASFRRLVLRLKRLGMDLPPRVQRFTKQDLSAYFSDIRDHIERVFETLDEAKETIDIYVGTDFILSSEKTNKVLAILTIIFTLTIPVTVIGTLYGMNVLLPGGILTGSWTFFGPYTTLMVLLLLALIPALLMLYYFRRFRWV